MSEGGGGERGKLYGNLASHCSVSEGERGLCEFPLIFKRGDIQQWKGTCEQLLGNGERKGRDYILLFFLFFLASTSHQQSCVLEIKKGQSFLFPRHARLRGKSNLAN